MIFSPYISALPLHLLPISGSLIQLATSASSHKESLPMERKYLGFFLLLVFLASQEMVVPGEARVCESQSHQFKGPCGGDHNCALVCRNEGFSGGNCRGFRRRCFCTKLC